MQKSNKSNQRNNASVALIDLIPGLFAIVDAGTGITEKVLPKLFSTAFSTKARGMSFGLAICKRIVEGMVEQWWLKQRKIKEPLSRLYCRLSQNLKLEVKTFG